MFFNIFKKWEKGKFDFFFLSNTHLFISLLKILFFSQTYNIFYLFQTEYVVTVFYTISELSVLDKLKNLCFYVYLYCK